MNSSPAMAPAASQQRMTYLAAGTVLLLTCLAGLLYYKWGGAIRAVGGVHASGVWGGSADGLTAGGVLRASGFYLQRVWLALAYGILIGATVRAFVPIRKVIEIIDAGGPARRQLAGGAAGAPLMLCSCCITPVFAGMYERGARLGTALTVMLASPGLNPAALLLTFLLFPRDVALARFGAALMVVLALPPLVERMVGPELRIRTSRLQPLAEEGGPDTPGELLSRFARSVGHMVLVTVPLVLGGVVLSSLILPASLSLPAGGRAAAVALIGAVAVLVALPTFFEIPLALLLLQLGAPGAAVAMLVAGPVINLPSLLILGREASTRVALAVAAGVWLAACLAGLLVRP